MILQKGSYDTRTVAHIDVSLPLSLTNSNLLRDLQRNNEHQVDVFVVAFDSIPEHQVQHRDIHIISYVHKSK